MEPETERAEKRRLENKGNNDESIDKKQRRSPTIGESSRSQSDDQTDSDNSIPATNSVPATNDFPEIESKISGSDVAASSSYSNDSSLEYDPNKIIKIENWSSSSSDGEDSFSDEETESIYDFIIIGWPEADIKKLLSRIKLELPKDDDYEFEYTLKTLDWEKIRFGKYSAVECRLAWHEIQLHLRSHKTLSELVHDANNLISKNNSFYL